MTIFKIKSKIDILITVLLVAHTWYSLHWLFALLTAVIAIIPAAILEAWGVKKSWTVPGKFLRQSCVYGLTFFVAYVVELITRAFRGTAQAGSTISENLHKMCDDSIGRIQDCSGNIEFTREFANIIMSSATEFSKPFGYGGSAISYVFLSLLVAYLSAAIISFVLMKYKG